MYSGVEQWIRDKYERKRWFDPAVAQEVMAGRSAEPEPAPAPAEAAPAQRQRRKVRHLSEAPALVLSLSSSLPFWCFTHRRLLMVFVSYLLASPVCLSWAHSCSVVRR